VRVLTNAFWLALCRVCAELTGFLLFAAIARSFGPAGTGEYSYAYALASFFAFLAASGIDEYGIRRLAASAPSDRGRLWSEILAVQGAQLALSIAVFALFLLATGGGHARIVVILEMSALLLGQYLAHTFFIPAMAAQQMFRPAITELACRFAAIGLGLLLVTTLHVGLPVLLVGFPLAGAALATAGARNARRRGLSLKLRWEPRHLLQTLRSTIPFTGAELLSQFYARTDLVLIAYLLGNSRLGFYATDVKFVEFGILPLYMLGTAAYPTLSRAAGLDARVFSASAQEFVRLMLFLGGWLATGLLCLVAPLIVPIFGAAFRPAVDVLPWFALLALMKAGEAALYRLMYATRRPTGYVLAILAGTAVTVALNLTLIPKLGLVGAVIAAIASVGIVSGCCAASLRRLVAIPMLFGAAARMAGALIVTAAALFGAARLGAGPWVLAAVGCGIYPLFGWLAGLLPNFAHSRLLRASGPEADLAGRMT